MAAMAFVLTLFLDLEPSFLNYCKQKTKERTSEAFLKYRVC